MVNIELSDSGTKDTDNILQVRQEYVQIDIRDIITHKLTLNYRQATKNFTGYCIFEGMISILQQFWISVFRLGFDCVLLLVLLFFVLGSCCW